MIPLGYWMAQRGAQRRLGTMEHPYEFTWYNLIDITLFTALMIAAIVLVTRHKESHRRFVFVAALCLVAPAATRWTLRIRRCVTRGSMMPNKSVNTDVRKRRSFVAPLTAAGYLNR